MDINVKVNLEISLKPEVLVLLQNLLTHPVAPEASSPEPEAVKEPVQRRSSSRSTSKTKAVEPEPLPELDPKIVKDVTPERVVTIEEARAKATELLKADPKNREKVAAALKEVGAAKLTEITEPADLKKFVELLEA